MTLAQEFAVREYLRSFRSPLYDPKTVDALIADGFDDAVDYEPTHWDIMLANMDA